MHVVQDSKAPASAETPGKRHAVRRTVRVGLLGLGNVGQAIIRVAHEWAARWHARGIDFSFEVALVRDLERIRAQRSQVVTNDARRLLSANDDRAFDVVVEVLGGVEPARTLVSEFLAAGVPVVTANKSLLAEAGPQLRNLAAQAGVPLRIEASVLAGVPFLGALAARPLVGHPAHITGILNGTSNAILSAMQNAGLTLDVALKEAQEAGYAEPDPSNDINGTDAAEKLTVLLGALGVAAIDSTAIERTDLEAVCPATLAAAGALDGCIRPVVCAAATGAVTAFAGPTFVPQTHPLARIDGVENCVQLDSPPVGRLTFSGPGAGPEVTAATLLDDVCEAVSETPRDVATSARLDGTPTRVVSAPDTPWLLRLSGSFHAGDIERILALLHTYRIWITRSATLTADDGATELAALTRACSRERIESAARALYDATGCTCTPLRALEDPR